MINWLEHNAISMKKLRKKKEIDQKVYDVVELDEKIKSQIDEDYTNIDHYKNICEELQLSLQDPDQLSNLEIRSKQAELDKYTSKIEKLENEFLLNEYLIRSQEIVQKWQKLIKIPQKICFMKSATSSKTDKLDEKSNKLEDGDEHSLNMNETKNNLLDSFLQVAKDYLEIDPISASKKSDFKCDCNSNVNFVENENNVTCSKCGVEHELFTNSTSFKDIHRVNMSVKYKYERASHFRDAVQQFQGKQNKKISSKVYEDLEETFDKHNLLVKSENNLKKYQKITRKHIEMFLCETGHNKHYEDVYLIAKKYGREPHQIAHLEKALYEDFDQVLSAYETLTDIKRSNFLNNQYVLYQLLRRRKYKCTKQDFNIIESKERLSDHDAIFQRICDVTQWTFVPVN